jgi:hypothetical protein
MHQPALVVDYLDALAHELRFDRGLARRVRSEAEDHLTQAIANDPAGDATEATRRAIARFGEPREIARQYAPSSLLRQVQHVGAVLVIAIAATFVFMKGRFVLYEFLQWPLSTAWPQIGVVGPMLARYVFRAALIAGIVGWIYIASRRAVPSLDATYRQQLKRCFLLPLVSSALLIGMVGLDASLLALRLLDTRPSWSTLVPLASVVFEVMVVATIAVLLRRTMQRAALAVSLFADQKMP